jgi:hypothetical protein
MKYIPVKSEIEAKELSKRLYRLSRPNPHPDDVTQFLIGWVIHPDTGAVMMEVPDDLDLPISTDCDSKVLSALFPPIVSALSVAVAETKIAGSKGKRVLLADILPTFWSEKQQTEEQMGADGWFGEQAVEFGREK